MTKQSEQCILRGLRKGGTCDSCPPTCQYYVSVHGLEGTGGRLSQAKIPLEYHSFLISDNPVRETQIVLYRNLDNYVKSFSKMFEEQKNGVGQYIKNVYLYSEEVGTGKTATASALANEFMARHFIGNMQRNITPSENAVYFLDCAEFQQLYTQFTRPNIPREIAEKAASAYYGMMERAKQSEFVVMDDIGVREATDGFRGDLHTIVNHRYTTKRPTVYTSNIPMYELSDVFDSRMYDRIRDLTFEYTFVGESQRGNRK